jgi:hypothetical protein
MKMSLYLRVIQPADLDEILHFEKHKLQEAISDEMERELTSWNARWRQEALNHYLPMGWSFLSRDRNLKSDHSSEGQLVGYFLAQPLLFFEGQTQTLWVEHMQYSTLQARDELCELAYKLSREKHFQKVLFPESQSIMNAVKAYKAQNWDPQVLTVATTKASSP